LGLRSRWRAGSGGEGHARSTRAKASNDDAPVLLSHPSTRLPLRLGLRSLFFDDRECHCCARLGIPTGDLLPGSRRCGLGEQEGHRRQRRHDEDAETRQKRASERLADTPQSGSLDKEFFLDDGSREPLCFAEAEIVVGKPPVIHPAADDTTKTGTVQQEISRLPEKPFDL
jgi:hypothetical protein